MSNNNDDAAALWASRLDNGPLDEDGARALGDWLSGDDRRAGALLRAEAGLAQVRRLRVLPVRDRRGDRMPGTLSRRRFGAWMFAAGGLAAAMALVVRPEGARFSTGTGEVRRVPLNDGSVVSINTASSLRVDIDGTRRRIVLDRGEAWFQVAHDRSRPFIVDVGRVRVEAVGTAFSLRRRAQGVDLLVTEGVVIARAGEATPDIRVRAGEKLFLPVEGAQPAPVTMPETIERQLAWRHGEVSLEELGLGEAAAEINRYNVVQITVDPAIAGERLTGYVRTNDPAAFARTAATLVGGRVVRRGDILHIEAR